MRNKGCLKNKNVVIKDGTVLVPLSKSEHAVVDASHWEKIKDFSWYISSCKRSSKRYAITKIDGKNIKMNRFLLGLTDPEVFVDHKNGNGLDNRLENLRIASKSQNEGNTPPRKTNTSGYKGVFWDKTKNRWLAQINSKDGATYLGRFSTKEEAARAYDKAARERFGEFAYLNFKDSK